CGLRLGSAPCRAARHRFEERDLVAGRQRMVGAHGGSADDRQGRAERGPQRWVALAEVAEQVMHGGARFQRYGESWDPGELGETRPQPDEYLHARRSSVLPPRRWRRTPLGEWCGFRTV